MSLEFLTDASQARVVQYPAGEPTVMFDGPVEPGSHQVVLQRGASAEDLMTVLGWAASVRRLGAAPSLLLPYLPGARADHEERAVGLDARVYADLLNTGDFARVVCLDPHSSVMPSMVERLRVVSAADLVDAYLPASLRRRLVGLIAPDDGAQSRVAEVAERLGLPVFHAAKHHDFATGRLSGFSCEPLPTDGDLLVVDDICDGGGTFLGLAAAVPEAAGRLHLWVTHGVFSGDAAALLGAFESLTTTDSHPGCRNVPGAAVVPTAPALLRRLAEEHP